MDGMEVIGMDDEELADLMTDDEDDEDDDDVEGSVLGYSGPMDGSIVGYDDEGEPIIVGASRKNKKLRRRLAKLKKQNRRLLKLKKLGWRKTQLAPGVIAPDQGMLPLPLAGQPSNTFALATQNITFEGQIQKPFRGERLLVSVVRTGTSATGRILGQLFVGTDLQQLDVPQFDVEQVGAPNAFGVRLTMKPAQPGVFIRLVCGLSNALTTTDTIFASVTLLGRLVH